MDAVPLVLLAGGVGRTCVFPAAVDKLGPECRTVPGSALILLARGRFACATRRSPECEQTRFGELLRRTFRNGMGLGVKEQVVARVRGLL